MPPRLLPPDHVWRSGSAQPEQEGKQQLWKMSKTADGHRLVNQVTGEQHWRRGGPLPSLRTGEDIGEEKALLLKGQMLDEKHYTVIVDRTGIVRKPDGEILCILYKNRLPPELLEAVRPIVHKAARQPVAGGNRTDAAGAGRAKRKRKDGSESNITGVPRPEELSDEDYRRLRPAKGGTFGYNARDVRGGQVYPCRLTAYSGALSSELMLMSELAQEVAEVLRWSANNAA